MISWQWRTFRYQTDYTQELSIPNRGTLTLVSFHSHPTKVQTCFFQRRHSAHHSCRCEGKNNCCTHRLHPGHWPPGGNFPGSQIAIPTVLFLAQCYYPKPVYSASHADG